MLDYHVHSSVSADSEEEMNEICAYAVKAGLKEICFTEHLDIDYPYDDIVFLLDLDLYDQKIKEAREKFPLLTIKQGMEVGLMPHVIDETKTMLAGRAFDFVILSQHVVTGKDPYYGDFFEKRTKKQAVTLYLSEVLQFLKVYQDFNVVGHLGFLSKFCPLKDKAVHYKDHSDLLDEILLYVIQNGKGLEVNTASFAIFGQDLPSQSILKRYRELKGEILTIGSDTHVKERVGDGYTRVTAYLKKLGFQYICTFDHMKPSFIKI